MWVKVRGSVRVSVRVGVSVSIRVRVRVKARVRVRVRVKVRVRVRVRVRPLWVDKYFRHSHEGHDNRVNLMRTRDIVRRENTQQFGYEAFDQRSGCVMSRYESCDTRVIAVL